MKPLVPSLEKRWATAGMMLAAVIAICGKGPEWILAAAVMLATIFVAVLWKAFEPRPQEIDPEKNIKVAKQLIKKAMGA